MNKIKLITIVAFFSLLLIPLIEFNFEAGVASEIDNRMLAENPFSEQFTSQTGDLTEDIESYVKDRIGYRDDMITIYTVLNDKVFGEMVHPSYTYGKNGYVFGKLSGNIEFSDYHLEFAKMIKRIQDYCEERNVPFVFVFEPSKSTVLSDKLKDGINYNADWIKEFFAVLDELGINYVDNTDLLRQKYEEGEKVFNKKYNSGHWNDLGAFYGVNNVIDNLSRYFPALQTNEIEEFTIKQVLNTTLPVSKFPINEYEPIFEDGKEYKGMTDIYDAEVDRNESYPYFNYIINEEEKENGSPKALVFQGSYMNGMGYKFLQNAFGEYIAVHDYQNVLNFEYYFNIFQPDCVVFEVAEYTFQDWYFSFEGMKSMDLNPNIDRFSSLQEQQQNGSDLTVDISKGNKLSKININGLPENVRYAYLNINGICFDLLKTESSGEYTVTVDDTSFNIKDISVITVDNELSKKKRYIW